MENSAITLTGEDLAAYNKAFELKNQGVEKFKAQDKEAAKKLMHESLEELKKIQAADKTVNVLQSTICQNMALIHKQAEEFADSLKMSEQALEYDPTNWKALTNKADISANWIHKLGKESADVKEMMEACLMAKADLDTAAA